MSKIKSPDGWKVVRWKDNSNHTWVNTMPKGYFKHFKKDCEKKKCKIKSGGGELVDLLIEYSISLSQKIPRCLWRGASFVFYDTTVTNK